MNWIADEFSVGKSEKIKVRIRSTGETFTLTIEQLFNIIYGDLIQYYKCATKEAINSFKYGFMGKIYTKLISKIKIWSGKHDASILRIGGAYDRNELEVESYNKSEDIEWKPIKQVMRHHTDNKKLMNVVTDNSNVTVTEDHSLYSWDTKEEIKTSDLKPGMNLLSKIGHDNIVPKYIKEIKEAPKEPYVYDLAIEGNENFFLDSGILAHNSYSISGVSLDIEKSSKYQSMKDEYIAEYDKLVEANKASIKIIKGLRQARYGVGVSSSLGPLSRPGVQSRRNLLSSSGGGF
jgi:intein/homing endonuclease